MAPGERQDGIPRAKSIPPGGESSVQVSSSSMGTLRRTHATLAASAIAQLECDWGGKTPEKMVANGAKIGIVSYGPFPIGRVNTEELPDMIPGNPWVVLETEHLRIASNLGPESLYRKQMAALEPVLERLRVAFPDLPRKIKRLDPWLRLHVMALRCEDFYDYFQTILRVTDEDFPEERADEGPFMGHGRYLGVKGKFELIFHSRRKQHQIFTKSLMGGKVTDAVRWYLRNPSRLIASIPAEDSDLRSDEWLYPHTCHLLSHLFLSAYKHFSYNPPIWLDEGLAHTLEREIEPLSTTMEGDEGTGPHRGDHQDWQGKDVRIARRGKHRNLAQLMRVKTFSELSQEDNIVCRSMVRFLKDEHPEKLATFIGGVMGQLDENGLPSGHDLMGLQRKLMKELWGWTPAQFDEAWKEWVLSR